MKVAKWGNSLAVRLPASLVEALNLKEGDEVEVASRDNRTLEVSQDATRQKALETMRRLRKPLPSGFKFNREELYERGYREPIEEGVPSDSREPGAAAD